MTTFLTKTARQKLARQAATKAHGKPSNHQVGQAGKVIDELVDDNPKRFIDFSNPRYCTPRHDEIITATVEALNPQQELI